MVIKILLLFSVLVTQLSVHAQQLLYTPEILLGHRSLSYLHGVQYGIASKWAVSNVTFLDTEYHSDKNNIFFIRNAVSYSTSRALSFHVGLGLKNPGSFASIWGQYKFSTPSIHLQYSVGTTYQHKLTLEQSLQLEYLPRLGTTLKGYFKVQATANLTRDEYQRGFQYIRMGIKSLKSTYGIAANLDQFNNSTKTLENLGLFFKYNFQ